MSHSKVQLTLDIDKEKSGAKTRDFVVSPVVLMADPSAIYSRSKKVPLLYAQYYATESEERAFTASAYGKGVPLTTVNGFCHPLGKATLAGKSHGMSISRQSLSSGVVCTTLAQHKIFRLDPEGSSKVHFAVLVDRSRVPKYYEYTPADVLNVYGHMMSAAKLKNMADSSSDVAPEHHGFNVSAFISLWGNIVPLVFAYIDRRIEYPMPRHPQFMLWMFLHLISRFSERSNTLYLSSGAHIQVGNKSWVYRSHDFSSGWFWSVDPLRFAACVVSCPSKSMLLRLISEGAKIWQD